jgi:hypothetical protein
VASAAIAVVAAIGAGAAAMPASAQALASLPPQASAPCGPVPPGQAGGYCGDGGPVKLAQLEAPRDVAALANGDLLVADGQAGVIRRISAGRIATVAGLGVPGDAPPSAPSSVAHVALSDPRGVAGLADGSFAIADAGLRAVLLVTPGGRVRTVLDRRTLAVPVDVVAIDANTLAVTDAAAGKVLAVDLRDGTTRTLARGLATPGQIALDPASRGLVVSEQSASPEMRARRATAGVVVRLTPDGAHTIVAGPGAAGVAGGLRFERLAGVFARPDGAVLVADRHVVYAVFPASGAVSVLAGVPPADVPGIRPAQAVAPGQSVAGVTPGQAEGIAVAGGDLLIADAGTSQIRRAPDAQVQPAAPAPPAAEAAYGMSGLSPLRTPLYAMRAPGAPAPCVAGGGLAAAYHATMVAHHFIRVNFSLAHTVLTVALARSPADRDSHVSYKTVKQPPADGVVLVKPKARGSWYVRVRARGGCNQSGPLPLG